MRTGIIYTPGEDRDLVYHGDVVTEARPVQRDGWLEWVEFRKGRLDCSIGRIVWPDRSLETLDPLPF